MTFNVVHRSRGVRHKVSALFPSRRSGHQEKTGHHKQDAASKHSMEKKGKEASSRGHHVNVDFVTLGMFIIDNIEFLPPTPSAKDILGGAGTYCALGARLFSPHPCSTSVSWIVDQGSDFPSSLTSLIDTWETSVIYRHDKKRKTTRAWNGYEGTDEKRSFKYLTPKKRLTAEDLTPDMLKSKTFHMVCSPLRCQELVADIKAKRKACIEAETSDESSETEGPGYPRPMFIWEPVPDLCIPDELINLTNTLPLVDIVSPNHTELAGFMGDDGLEPETGQISTVSVERACEQLLGSMPLSSFTLVVRAGEKGCYITKNGGRKKRKGNGPARKKKHRAAGTVNTQGLQPDTDMEALFAGLLDDIEKTGGEITHEEIEVDAGIERWVPAYHMDSAKVVDPTGGGNTFLGGLGVALARGEGVEEAAIWGSVAASFAIEQVGVPKLTKEETTEGEKWNGVIVGDRLKEFRQRIQSLKPESKGEE